MSMGNQPSLSREAKFSGLDLEKEPRPPVDAELYS
jgi:hypothetical protein